MEIVTLEFGGTANRNPKTLSRIQGYDFVSCHLPRKTKVVTLEFNNRNEEFNCFNQLSRVTICSFSWQVTRNKIVTLDSARGFRVTICSSSERKGYDLRLFVAGDTKQNRNPGLGSRFPGAIFISSSGAQHSVVVSGSCAWRTVPWA